MNAQELAPHDGSFVVVEADDDWYLGTLAVHQSCRLVTVYTGRTGRPPVIDFDDVDAVTDAALHPAVTGS